MPQDIGGIAYFELPFSIMGNNIKSYGGYLSYILNYRGRGQGPNNSPDIIIIVSLHNIELLTTFFTKKWKTNSEFLGFFQPIETVGGKKLQKQGLLWLVEKLDQYSIRSRFLTSIFVDNKLF